MKRLTESLTEKGTKTLDKIVGSISHKYAGEFGISQEDLYQELMLKFYSTFPEYTDVHLEVNRALVNKVLENAAIDYYRYSRLRYDRTEYFYKPSEPGVMYAGDDTGDMQNSGFGYEEKADRSANIGRSRFRKPDSGLVLQELLKAVRKKFGKYSDEERYFMGQIAFNGMLDLVKDVMTRDDYKLAVKIEKKADIGWFIDPDDPLGIGNHRYKKAAKNVDNFLQRQRKSLDI